MAAGIFFYAEIPIGLILTRPFGKNDNFIGLCRDKRLKGVFLLFFQKDYKGMAELKNIRIAVSGIYDYALEELPTLRVPLPGQGAPDWVEKKQIYKIYRPAFVLAAACDKFKMLPLTHHHPNTPVDGQNFRKLAVGYTGENPFIDWIKDTDEVGIRSTVMIYDDEALDAYERGEIQLSPGYVASFEWQKGKAPDGQEYDIVMKEITDVNHLALLPAGRGGEYAVVMDGAKREPSVFDLARTKDGAPKGNDNASKDHVKKFERKPQGKVADWFVDIAKQSGFDFSGYEHETTNHFENHVLKEHGKGNENDPANVPVEQKDFDRIKDIIDSPDFIAFGVKREGEDRVIYAKSFDDGITLYFEEILDGKKNKKLRGKTMFKRTDKVTGEKLKKILCSNRKNDVSEMKIAYSEVTDSSIYRSTNGVGGQTRRQAGNCKYSLMHYSGNVKDEIKKAGVLRETASDDGTVHDERVADTTRVASLNITDTAPEVKSVFEIAAGSVFDRVRR